MPHTIPIESINIGERDREELGDIEALAASIDAVGLLHPVVVTADYTLVAGDRRLAAAQQLGWAEVPVTVVDLTTVADVLRAEADENTCRKGLTPYEASQARQRRAKVLAADAAERKSSAIKERDDKGRAAPTGSKLDPVEREATKTRKAAAIGTGYSGSTLDKVDKIRDIAERGVIRQGKTEVPAPEPVREIAAKALEDVKQTGAAIDRSSKNLERAIAEYVEADPDVNRAKFRKRLGDAVRHTMNGLPTFDAEAVAEECGRDSEMWERIETARDMLERWCANVDEARPTGLRVVEGGRR